MHFCLSQMVPRHYLSFVSCEAAPVGADRPLWLCVCLVACLLELNLNYSQRYCVHLHGWSPSLTVIQERWVRVLVHKCNISTRSSLLFTTRLPSWFPPRFVRVVRRLSRTVTAPWPMNVQSPSSFFVSLLITERRVGEKSQPHALKCK